MEKVLIVTRSAATELAVIQAFIPQILKAYTGNRMTLQRVFRDDAEEVEYEFAQPGDDLKSRRYNTIIVLCIYPADTVSIDKVMDWVHMLEREHLLPHGNLIKIT